MKPKKIECELIRVRERKDGRIGCAFVLKELNLNSYHEINIDESIEHVKARLLEQYNGDPREGIFLSRGMTNIDINTKGDTWDINQEDWNWYTFSKQDILKI